MWAYEENVAKAINESHVNSVYLPDENLPESIRATSDIHEATKDARMVFFVTPSHYFRSVFKEAIRNIDSSSILVSCTKGIEEDTLLTISKVMFEEAGDARDIVVLSGPSFAKEAVAGLPAAVSVASKNEEAAKKVQEAISQASFRAYVTDDVIGLELGGSVKNIIAIAAGISDALGLGNNARAALITRGVAELSRLGEKMGAKPMTFAGLAGVGDLLLTCTGNLSRNRTVGMELGKGRKLKDILGDMKDVAEGVRTCKAVYRLALENGVEMPIVAEVHRVLYEDKDPREAVTDLMTRELKRETEH